MVVGICRCKDESDIIESTVRHMLDECDAVIVEDNASTDDTLDILAAIDSLRLIVRHDDEIGYYQSAAMSRLAAFAAAGGASWVVPFDADEYWYSPHGRIADVLDEQPAAVATAKLYDHIPTGLDGTDEDPVKRIGWRRREPAPLPKVACRPVLCVTIEQGNHAASYPAASSVDDLLVVRHYALRSPEQMIRKARNGGKAYAATSLPEHVGAHWRQWNELTDEQLADVFREFYWSADPAADPSLIFDPAPMACPLPS
jgi:hypothetical protein